MSLAGANRLRILLLNEGTVKMMLNINHLTTTPINSLSLLNIFIINDVIDILKSIISIGLSLLILLAVLKVHIVSHFCGGMYVSSKFSFTGENAGCGMEECVLKDNIPGKFFHQDCCRNVEYVLYLSEYQVENVNSAPVQEIKISQFTESPFESLKNTSSNILLSHLVVKPPGEFFNETVSQELLCVYRI